MHRCQELRRAGLDRTPRGVLDGDAEGLARTGDQAIAEGGELDFELLVAPRHVERRSLGDQLVIGDQRQARREPAAVPLGDRNVDPLRARERHRAAPDAFDAAQQLELDRRVLEAGMNPQPRAAAGLGAGAVEGQVGRQGERRLGAGDDEVELGARDLAEAVACLVAQAIGAAGDAGERDRADTRGLVLHDTARHLGAVGEEGERLFGCRGGSPARTQPVARGREAIARLLRGVGGSDR